MRGAPCGLRPYKVHNHLMLLCCRERPMCRSALIERYLLTYSYRKRRFIPPHQSLTRQLPPKGKPSVGSANCIKSASNFNSSYFQRLRTLQGRSLRIAPLQSAKTLGNGSNIQPKRNDPCVVPFNSILTFLPLLSGSGDEARQQVAAVQIPLDGIWLGAAGNSSTEYGYTRICTNKKKEDKNPLS